ncbi:MAG TPA: rhomboid family intramembrane serine protease [Bacteroidia bacterium]|nr:rhomboid family intramembrane serine protease [Bacteroidia bacterium]
MSFTRDIQTQLKGTYRSVVIFLLINVAVFLTCNVLIHLVAIGGDSETGVGILFQWLCMQSKLDGFLPHFWTIGTYMFVHISLWHILSNMLWLWFLGRIFCEVLGSKRMVNVYLLGGITGGIVYFITETIINSPVTGYLLGASGAVMAIVVAVATYTPDYRIFPFGIPMKLKWLALISFALTTLLNLSENTGGKAAHLGGALFGLAYGYSMRKGNPLANIFKRKTKLRVAHKRVSDTEFVVQKTSVRKRIDEILDKISKSGYDSLTKDEKEFLQKNHDKF